MRTFVLLFAAMIMLPTSVEAQELPAPNSDAKAQQGEPEEGFTTPRSMTEKASYLIGFNIANEWKTQPIEIDYRQIAHGIIAASKDKNPGMTDEEIQSVMTAFQQELRRQNQARIREMMETNKKQGEAFMAANAEKEGVEKLENGCQYIVLNAGEGTPPTATDRIKLHFKESAIDGSVFQSTSGGEPEVYTVGSFPIRGVVYAIQRMPPGSKWRIFVPADLAYGHYGSQSGVQPNQTLVYEVEIVEILKQ